MTDEINSFTLIVNFEIILDNQSEGKRRYDEKWNKITSKLGMIYII